MSKRRETARSSAGIRSVRTFLIGQASLLAWVVPGLFVGVLSTRPEQARNRALLVAAAAFAGVYGLFFARTDTLVDTYGQFLPLVPFMVLLAAPALTLRSRLWNGSALPARRRWARTLAFLLAFGSADLIGGLLQRPGASRPVAEAAGPPA